MTLGNFLCCLKDVKPLLMFDGECRMSLQPMQGNRASTRRKGEVSSFISAFIGNLVYILTQRPGGPFKIHVCSAMSGLLSSCEEHLGIILGQGIAIGNPIQVRRRPRVPFHLPQGNWDAYQFSRLLRYRLIIKH